MSGDWIKMQVNLPDKPEVWQIAGMLSIDADSVVGKLVRVWSWFDSHTADGNAAGVSFPLIDRIAGVAGFAEAMSMAGWLEQNGHVLSLPKFSRHNGKTAKNRALTNERVAKHRASSNAESNAAIVTKIVTREEKRREEETPPTPEGERDPEGFSDFWSAWPATERKQDRKKCAAKWRRGKLAEQLPAILASVEALKQSRQWRDGFEPAPLTYLNGERWKDGAPTERKSDVFAGAI